MYIQKVLKFRFLGVFFVIINSEQRDNFDTYKHFLSIYFLFEHPSFNFISVTWRTGGKNVYSFYGKTGIFSKPSNIGSVNYHS